MKKWISHLAFAALVTPLAANAASQAFTGFVGGVNVGMIQSEAKLNQFSEIATSNAAVAWSIGAPTKLSDISGTVGFNLGFSRCFNPCINWGIELRANFMSLDNSLDESFISSGGVQSITKHTSVKLTQQYAAIAKLAYLFKCDAQFYVFLGPQWGNFKLKSYQNFDAVTQTTTQAAIKAEHEHYKAGWYWGVGLEQLLNPCTSIGLEYNYADYGHLNFAKKHATQMVINGVPDANTHFDKYHNMHMITNTFLLKFNYYFC